MVRASDVLLFAVSIVALAGVGAADHAPPRPKPRLTHWLTQYDAARLQARQQNRVILGYFSGSDWEDYTQKLDKDVLNTDMFRDWAAEHVILLQMDFPKTRSQSANLKSQNTQLKQKYSIAVVPTFILMDSSGLPFARAGFDEAKLRDDEGPGQPKAWIKYLEETIKNRPPDEELNKQKGLAECLAYGRKHFLSSVLLINQGRFERPMQVKDELVKNQQFVRFINRNVAYAEIEWPYDSDSSANAVAFRAFAETQQIGPAPLQLVVYDMQTKKVRGKITSIDPGRVDNLIALIQAQLPKLDYSNGWIEDYRLAQAVAQQQKRYIFLAFTALDSSEFSKKMDDEIFKTDEFKTYARKHLVTVRVDFPTAATQPATVSSQNKILAEMFAIRGYPMVIVMNPQGQKIAESKYMKGGPEAFLKQLSAAVKRDEDRRALLMGDSETKEN